MTFKERWIKHFNKTLTDEERISFNLWVGFSKGKISEAEFQSKMDVNIMPRLLGKMSASRINALEDEVDQLRKRVASLEEKARKQS